MFRTVRHCDDFSVESSKKLYSNTYSPMSQCREFSYGYLLHRRTQVLCSHTVFCNMHVSYNPIHTLAPQILATHSIFPTLPTRPFNFFRAASSRRRIPDDDVLPITQERKVECSTHIDVLRTRSGRCHWSHRQFTMIMQVMMTVTYELPNRDLSYFMEDSFHWLRKRGLFPSTSPCSGINWSIV